MAGKIEEFNLNLANQVARSNLAPLLSQIQAAGATKEQEAYGSLLGDAQERGVAFGRGGGSFGPQYGNISGIAAQGIAPAVADIEYNTQRDIMGAISGEVERLRQVHNEEQDRFLKEDELRRKRAGNVGSLIGTGLGTIASVAFPPLAPVFMGAGSALGKDIGESVGGG